MKMPAAWDKRDYQLWSDIKCLPSFGMLGNDDRMISRDEVCKLLVAHAERRSSAKEERRGK